jgi:hypothetical protein
MATQPFPDIEGVRAITLAALGPADTATDAAATLNVLIREFCVIA